MDALAASADLGPLFRASDISALAGSVPSEIGLSKALVEKGYHHAIAAALDDAFRGLTFFDRRSPTLRDFGKRYEEIAKSARKLLDSLGYEADWDLSVCGSGRLSDIHADLLVNYGDVFGDHWHRGPLAKDLRSIRDATKATVFVTSKLAELSEKVERAPTRGGQAGLDFLFQRLAGAYFACFGIAPDIGSDRTDPNAPAALWAASVVSLARNRMIHPPACLASISAHAAFANRMRKGWLTWRALPDAERWPGHVWWPHVWTDEPGRSVPDWVKNPE